jgi:glycosyltransferase involved in cell wall biosynthesis
MSMINGPPVAANRLTTSSREGEVPVASLVSAIIPAYNASATIERALQSVLAQTYGQLEIIVMDDGSIDDTAAIVERISREDPRIILLRQPNEGVATARNVSVAHARGEFIAPLDSDDIWHPLKIEKQMAVMVDGGSRIGLVYCLSRFIDEHDIIVSNDGRQVEARGDVFARLVAANFIGNASSPLIRRCCLEQVGGYDSSLRAQGAQGCEDLKVYLAIAEHKDFDLVPEYLVGYRTAAGSMSRNHASMARSWEIVIGDARSRHPELPLWLFRWARGNYYRWLALNCLSHKQVCRGLYYLAIAIVHDPSGNVSLWLIRVIAQLITRPIKHLRIMRLPYKLYRAIWGQSSVSSAWGMHYVDACHAANDGPSMRPRECYRQTIISSLTVRSRDRGAEAKELRTSKRRGGS